MTDSLPVLRVAWLGPVPYEHALEIQRGMLDQRKRGEILDTLLLLEHPHVYTLGRRAVREHVLASPDVLQAMGAKVVETDRGGEVTYHGPGQLVGYPIMSIREAGLGPVSYVRILEQTVIDTLRLYGVSGHRVVGKTGVWVGGEPGAKPPHGQNPAGQKVSAIGVRVSAGVAMHGFALNVSTDLAYFSHIVPCGMPHLETASIASLTGASPATREVATQVARHLAGHLQRQLRWTASDSLAA